MTRYQPKIAICFFGIPRSVRFTHKSIEEKIVKPCRASGSVTKFAHFFLEKEINNSRTNEIISLNKTDSKFLNIDNIVWSAPNSEEFFDYFNTIKKYGDWYQDSFQSVRNLVHQVCSIKLVYLQTREFDPDIVVFARPDLYYHDSLEGSITWAVDAWKRRESVIFCPDWQRWGGVNDRFSIAVGRAAMRAYGCRVDVMEDFCVTQHHPLHAERLLRHALRKASIPIKPMRPRASRVRANAVQSWEDFENAFARAVSNRIEYRLKPRLPFVARILSDIHWRLSRRIFGDRSRGIEPPPGVSLRSREEEEKLRLRSGDRT